MKKDILRKIDLLVEMSGTANTYETLQEELQNLDTEIAELKQIIKRLKISLSRSDYVNANERIIDENIKMGIENRLKCRKRLLESCEEKIKNISLEEENSHASITSKENELERLKVFLESLELKLKSDFIDKKTYSFYENLINKTNQEITDCEEKLNQNKDAYNEITNKLASLGNEKRLLINNIEEEEKEYQKVSTSLKNTSSYIDTKRKKEDEDFIDEYQNKLEALETNRLTIITDAAYIGHEATSLYLDGDNVGALAKIGELVTIVNAMPYMEEKYSELDELLATKTRKRDEFASSIEDKKYLGQNVKAIEIRTKYLKQSLTKLEKEQKELLEKIKSIDTKEIPDLIMMIENIKECRDNLDASLKDYKKVLNTNQDYKTPKKEAMLKSAFKKKSEELHVVENILSSFETNLQNLVIYSKKLGEQELSKYDNECVNIKNELHILEKAKMLKDGDTEILAIEKDKDTLKELCEDVEAVTHRKKYKQLPNEIYDEIEMLLNDNQPSQLVSASNVNLEDYRIEDVKTEELSEIHEEKNVEEPKNIIEPITVTSIEDIEDHETVKFPPRVSKDEKKDLLKVVSIESLEEPKPKEEPKKEENFANLDDFMINDFNANEYISFNDLLDGDNDA